MSSDLQHLIRDFYLARLGLLLRHEEVARQVSQYDANNAYQYVINREETHVSWLQHALLDLGAAIPADPAPPSVQSGSGADAWKQLALRGRPGEPAVRGRLEAEGRRRSPTPATKAC